MINLRIARQSSDFDCGATALQVVLEYYGVEMRNDELLKELQTDEYGTCVDNIIALSKNKGFTVFASELVSLKELKQFIDEGYPVIVLVQAWAERHMTIEGWKTDYEDGHYVVVIGYQGPIIVFEDPSSTRRTWLTEREFLARWHDRYFKTGRKLEHFAIVLKGKEPIVKIPEHMR
jgi:predicted double-glycine peptidase